MAANEIELGRKVKNDELRFPEDCNNVGPHLRHFIKSMLNKDPSKRPTLETVMRHEWVTNEGAMPLPLTIYDDYEDSDDEEDEEDDRGGEEDLLLFFGLLGDLRLLLRLLLPADAGRSLVFELLLFNGLL